MTKEEFFEIMESEQSEFYEYFTKIPESLQTSEVAERWIACCHETIAGAEAQDFFAEIVQHKPEIITDRIRMLAVSLSPDTLHQIKPEDTPAYREIALLAISKSSRGIHLLNKEFHTPEMLQAIFERSPERIDLWPKSHHWMRPLVTPEMKVDLLETNLRFALSLDEKDVSPKQWIKLLTHNLADYKLIGQRNRLPVLVDFLKEGGWPAVRGSETLPRHDSIHDALSSFKNASGYQSAKVLYKALVHTFPIEEVLVATDHHSKIPLLVEIYPDATLRKNMKHNRALRAHLLENDLGM